MTSFVLSDVKKKEQKKMLNPHTHTRIDIHRKNMQGKYTHTYTNMNTGHKQYVMRAFPHTGERMSHTQTRKIILNKNNQQYNVKLLIFFPQNHQRSTESSVG